MVTLLQSAVITLASCLHALVNNTWDWPVYDWWLLGISLTLHAIYLKFILFICHCVLPVMRVSAVNVVKHFSHIWGQREYREASWFWNKNYRHVRKSLLFSPASDQTSCGNPQLGFIALHHPFSPFERYLQQPWWAFSCSTRALTYLCVCVCVAYGFPVRESRIWNLICPSL